MIGLEKCSRNFSQRSWNQRRPDLPVASEQAEAAGTVKFNTLQHADHPSAGLSERLKPGWVFRWLKDPASFRPQSIEPNNNLSDEEANALTAYLMSLK